MMNPKPQRRKIKMGRKKDKFREEARNYVGGGHLRYAMEKADPVPSEEAMQKIIDACAFGLNL